MGRHVLAVLAGSAMALLLWAPTVSAEWCVICYGDEQCGPSSAYGGPCCCNITYIGGGYTMCTQWCYGCHGYGQPPNCPNACPSCYASSRFDGMKFASLLNVASNSSDGLAEFMFTPTAFENLAQKAPLLAMLLKNLSGDCKTKTHYTKPVIALNAPFGGRVTLAAPFNYSGRYSGTVTTKDGLAHVEVVLAATTDAPGARRVRAVVAQSGDLQNYSDSGSPLD